MNITVLIRILSVLAMVLSVVPMVWAQSATLPAAAVPKDEAAAIAQGWVLLAEGKHDEASRAARALSTRFPRSVAALALLIETDIARGGATTALDSYDAWVGARTLEEPAALRRVARSFLYEWSRQTKDAATRNAALVALAEDGDEQARAIAGATEGTSEKAAAGDPRAVDGLVAKMRSTPGSKVAEIQTLGNTRNPRAAAPIAELLGDPLPENRAAAAEALGKLDYRDAIPRLKPLLEDPRGLVRVAAAGALFQMGDASGAPVLEELAGSEHASVRRTAALLMASQPTESWKALVRGLASDPDPATRLDAARLMVPHDPEFSRAIFDQLVADPNVAIRELAGQALAESPLAGIAELRRLLRTAAGPVKVRAAARILALTR